MSDGRSGDGLFGKVKKFKDQAGRVGREAIKTAGSAKDVVQAGLDTSKRAAERASEVVNRDRVAQGIEMTSKGADFLAKGARLASKGAGSLGNTIEKASKGIRELSKKVKK